MALATQRKSNVLSFDRAFKARRLSRPTSPQSLPSRAFEASPTAATWIRETFIRREALLYNPDHQHLEFAKIGVVWTGVLNNRQQRTVLATCETTQQVMGGAWKKARAEQQLEDWFGDLPDFLITLYAPALASSTIGPSARLLNMSSTTLRRTSRTAPPDSTATARRSSR